jgi:hypothetical protein
VPCPKGLDQVARESNRSLNIRAQFVQLHFIGRTATAFNGNVMRSERELSCVLGRTLYLRWKCGRDQ